jgi:hypothetical protein
MLAGLPKFKSLTLMCRFATDGPLDVEAFRARLRKMTDAQLLRYGKAARYMCSPDAYFGEAPRETFVIQLRECREEWKRRKAAKLIYEYGFFTADC